MAFEKHDAMLWQILLEKHTIVGFLDSVFGFLSRKTDFYHTMVNENESIGFPPGVREQLLLTAMKKFNNHSSKHAPHSSHCEPVQTVSCKTNLPDVCGKVIVESAVQKETRMFNENEYHNGAQFTNYCWSQTINDLEIFVNLPETVKSSKHINVKIDTNYIKLIDLNSNNSLLDGHIFEKCKNNDAVWSINGKKLTIQLDKIKEKWWTKCFISEPDIDLTKIDSTRSLYDLPEESQAVIEKLKWDQQQKMLGFPTSEDLKHEAILRKAWDVEGSPFKGQDFDPSIVQFQ